MSEEGVFAIVLVLVHLYCSAQHFNLQIPELHFSGKGPIRYICR